MLDEADEMLSMGFIEEIESILAATPTVRQTALFSATMPDAIRRLAAKYMQDPQFITIPGEQVTVAATEQRYYLVHAGDKTAALTRLFEVEDIVSALIFVRTRAGTSELANELSSRGFPAEALNGDLNQEARERTLNRFRQRQIKVLVATDVAARGLDIEGITHVFNYDLPHDAEGYVHRIGRTGRAGKTGIAITFFTPHERRRVRDIERFTHQKLILAHLPTADEIMARRQDDLVRQLNVWIQRGRCRQERAIVENLVAQGVDLVDIAAAALKLARAEEKQRPIYEVRAVAEEAPRRSERSGRGLNSSREERRPRGRSIPHDSASHEPGMVRLSMSMGRSHGVRPADVVGAIAFHADIPGSTIGKIYIEDQHTLVDVPETLVSQVLAKTGKYIIRKHAFTVRARLADFSRSNIRPQTITHTRLSDYKARARGIRLDLPPEITHINAQQVGFGFIRIPPNFLEQMPVSQYLPGVLDQNAQYIVFRGGQRYLLVLDCNQPAGQVHAQFPRRKYRLGASLGGSAQGHTDARH